MNYAFDIKVAQEYGVNEAIMINNFVFWIAKNKANGRNQHEGHTWTFNSKRAYKALFPFWSDSQIKTVLGNLIKKGVLITGNYNKIAYDRTLWYAFESENKFLPCNDNQSISDISPMDKTESTNRIVEDSQPIPDINTSIKQDINTYKGIDFNEFWELYDYKKARQQVFKKWIKLNKTDQEDCLKALPAYIKNTPDKQYRKHPTTYLNNRAWEDEIIVKTSTPAFKREHDERFIAMGIPALAFNEAYNILKNKELQPNQIKTDMVRILKSRGMM